MQVNGRIVAAVANATSKEGALHAVTRVIAEAVNAGQCIIFVREAKNGLVPRARTGGAVEPTVMDYATLLGEKALGEVLPARGSSLSLALIAVPVASINEAIGAIVALRAASAPFTVEETMRLSGAAAEIVELIESVRLIETIEDAVATPRRVAEDSELPPSSGERVLRGVAASPGVAIGAALFRNTFPRALARRDSVFRGQIVESARARDAFEKTRNDLVRLQSAAASEIGEEQALIFGAHLLLLNDPMFAGFVDQGFATGQNAAIAVDDAFDEIVRRLRDARDPYVQERIEDVEDLRSRILGYLVGVEGAGKLAARLVVSSRTTPSLVVELKARGALGIASELGGVTSHGVLLARALGVPAVTGIDRLTNELIAGDDLVIDGDEGLVIIRPTAQTRAIYARRIEAAERRRTGFLQYRDRPACTADGVRFGLQANIALGADIELARENRADGIGLYRTEFPFIVREGLPTIAEQVRIYGKAYAAFPDGPVTFRLLDLAGDKFLPGGQLGASRDTFHGYRSIRILFDYPHVLRDQVRAFSIAAAGRPLRILIPMVTSLEDVARIKELVSAALADTPRPVTYGVMIETPAAVELTADLAHVVDFFSIGTNDLMQYALVVDREDPRISSARHGYHPAILRMIRRVAMLARENGKLVTVCGEMATRPDLAIALLAMGIHALSVTPRAIPELKQALAGVPLEPLRASVDALLAASTVGTVERILRGYMADGKPLTESRRGEASAAD
jgi:phosphotransferase system, enzyme I, PtsP